MRAQRPHAGGIAPRSGVTRPPHWRAPHPPTLPARLHWQLGADAASHRRSRERSLSDAFIFERAAGVQPRPASAADVRPFLRALDAACTGSAAEWVSALLRCDADVEAAAEAAGRAAAAQGALCVELALCPATLAAASAQDAAHDAAAAERAVAAAAAGLTRGAGPHVLVRARRLDAPRFSDACLHPRIRPHC